MSIKTGFFGLLLVLLLLQAPVCARQQAIQCYAPDGYFLCANGEITLCLLQQDTGREHYLFTIVPGLAAGDHVSIQCDKPGHFIFHQDDRVRVGPVRNVRSHQLRATFKQVRGLADPDWLSFESMDKPGWYLVHHDYRLFLEPYRGRGFARNATFRLVGAPQHGHNEALELDMCRLPGRQGWRYRFHGNRLREDQAFRVMSWPFQETCLLVADTMGSGFNRSARNLYMLPGSVPANRAFTLRLGLRLLSQQQMRGNAGEPAFSFGAHTGTHSLVVGITRQGIVRGDGRTISRAVDTTRLHTYELRYLPGRGGSLYVDGTYIAGLDAKRDSGENGLYFGDTAALVNSRVEIHSLYYSKRPEDQGLSERLRLDPCKLPGRQGWRYFLQGNPYPEHTVFSAYSSSQGCLILQNTLGQGFGNASRNGYEVTGKLRQGPLVYKLTARVVAEEVKREHTWPGFAFGVEMEGKRAYIAIGEDRVYDTDNRVVARGMDTSRFHSYELRIYTNSGYSLYVDGKRMASGPLRSGQGNRLFFGDLAEYANARVEIRECVLYQ